MPTSNWVSSVFLREANRTSQASTNSLPAPRARPRIEAMVTTGARDRRTRKSIHAGHSGRTDSECRGPARVVLDVVVGQVELGVDAVEDHDVEVRVLLDQANELSELRTATTRATAIAGSITARPPSQFRHVPGEHQTRDDTDRRRGAGERDRERCPMFVVLVEPVAAAWNRRERSDEVERERDRPEADSAGQTRDRRHQGAAGPSGERVGQWGLQGLCWRPCGLGRGLQCSDRCGCQAAGTTTCLTSAM